MNYEQRVRDLQLKLAEAMGRRDYVKINKIQAAMRALSVTVEQRTLSNIIEGLSEKKRDEIIVAMNKVFAFSDLLQGYALDFQSAVQKLDKGVQSIDICRKAKEAAKICLSVTKEITRYKDDKYNESFQNMCDEIDMVATNIVYKQHQKSKNESRG